MEPNHLPSLETRIQQLVDTGRKAFRSGRTRKLRFCEIQLRQLGRMLNENQEAFLDALGTDLRKSKYESLITEIELIKNDIRLALANLWKWSTPEAPSKDLVNMMDTVQIKREPYGLVLIVANSYFPLLVLLRPLVGAIAASNCVILKPSEKCKATAQLVTELLPKYLDTECYQVFNGGPEETQQLTRQRFDYIFFTGSTQVGKSIRKASNEFLTPLTLELGGKNPTFVDESTNFDIVARRLMWGKIINSGQSCIAPDYVMCTKNVEKKLVEACGKAVKLLLGDHPKSSEDYCRIIDDFHYNRLVDFLNNCEIAMGGNCDSYERFIEPTIVTNVRLEDPIMHEEVFGPILPIVIVDSPNEALRIIKSFEKPMAIYVFSNDRKTIDKFVLYASSGGVCVNDVLMQFMANECPFGGVGMSGIGSYGGKYTYETFSHKKTCVYRDLGSLSEKFGSMRYPPYVEGLATSMLLFFLQKRNYPSLGWMKHYLIFFLGVAVTAAYYYYAK